MKFKKGDLIELTEDHLVLGGRSDTRLFMITRYSGMILGRRFVVVDAWKSSVGNQLVSIKIDGVSEPQTFLSDRFKLCKKDSEIGFFD